LEWHSARKSISEGAGWLKLKELASTLFWLKSKMKIVRTLIIILLVFNFAHGEDSCPTKDLLQTEPLASRKNTAQTGMGWCCSFAFVDALSIKYGKNISPIDLAISQGKIQGKSESCFPLTELVDTINKSHGVCAEEDFSYSEAYNIPPEKRIEAQKKSIELMGADFTSMMWKTNAFSYTKLEIMYEIATKTPSQVEQDCLIDKQTVVPFFKNIKNLREVAEVLKQTLNQNFQSFLYEMSKKNCKNRISSSIQHENIDFTDKKIALETMLTSLQNEKPPILVINATSLFHVEGRYWSKFTGALVGNHAVSVVGSRRVGEKCYLKVRDSSFGGLDCVTKKSEDIICSKPEKRNEMTYEIEADALIEATRSGLTIK